MNNKQSNQNGRVYANVILKEMQVIGCKNFDNAKCLSHETRNNEKRFLHFRQINLDITLVFKVGKFGVCIITRLL
jgi:hypothetical protein